MNFERPTLLLNPAIARQNIEHMARKASQSGVRFRPHFKTHQSAAVGQWFADAGVQAITVSSVDMARYFAAHGWRDITIAFPVNWRQIDKINELAAEIKLNLLVESVDTIEFLHERLKSPVNLWLKIDTGYHRTGQSWDDFAAHARLVDAIAHSDKLHLSGALTHSGHSYKAQGDGVRAVYRETVERLQAVRDNLKVPEFEISIGDTPCCSVIEDFSEVNEIRPGNFVFYDVMQAEIGSCNAEDIAVGLVCPVIAKYPDRNVIFTYGGTVHLSTEFLPHNDERTYGAVALLTESGWSDPLPDCYVSSLSQEHGKIHATPALMEQVQIGDVLVVLPIHSCLTVNLHNTYQTPAGELLPIWSSRLG